MSVSLFSGRPRFEEFMWVLDYLSKHFATHGHRYNVLWLALTIAVSSILQKDIFTFRQHIPAYATRVALLSGCKHCTSST